MVNTELKTSNWIYHLALLPTDGLGTVVVINRHDR